MDQENEFVTVRTTVDSESAAHELADRIVAERARTGPFRKPADLTRVHGIGDKRAEQFQGYMRFD